MTNNGTLMVQNGIAKGFIFTTSRDRIDWEEIVILCMKIYLEIPAQKDLVKIE